MSQTVGSSDVEEGDVAVNERPIVVRSLLERRARCVAALEGADDKVALRSMRRFSSRVAPKSCAAKAAARTSGATQNARSALPTCTSKISNASRAFVNDAPLSRKASTSVSSSAAW